MLRASGISEPGRVKRTGFSRPYGIHARLSLAGDRLWTAILPANHRLQRTSESHDDRVGARRTRWASSRGQSLVEWTMIAGVLAAAGILFTEWAVPMLRLVVRYVATSVRTIAP